jgi:hypothetical protein
MGSATAASGSRSPRARRGSSTRPTQGVPGPSHCRAPRTPHLGKGVHPESVAGATGFSLVPLSVRADGDARIHAKAKLRGARSITPAWHGKRQRAHPPAPPLPSGESESARRAVRTLPSRPQRARDGPARGRLHLGQSERGQRDAVCLAGSDMDAGRTGSLLLASCGTGSAAGLRPASVRAQYFRYPTEERSGGRRSAVLRLVQCGAHALPLLALAIHATQQSTSPRSHVAGYHLLLSFAWAARTTAGRTSRSGCCRCRRRTRGRRRRPRRRADG